MGEWKEIPEILRLSRYDAAVWGVTFLLTVLADLTVAVEVGLVLAAMLFIRRIANTTTVTEVTTDYLRSGQAHILQDKDIPAYVKILRIHGPFLFGVTDKLTEWEARIPEMPPIVVLRLRNMTAVDATGLHAIEEFADKLRKSGRELILCGALAQPARLMANARFHQHVGEENICANVEDALERARALYVPAAA
jgi:SulP family sulfate permease